MFNSLFLRNTLGLLSAVFCLAWLSGCSQPAQHEALPPDAVVLAFGDSVTFGVGAGNGDNYPEMLATLTGWTVVNAGISGDTARAAGSRLQPLLDSHQPDLVIIELGGNDFLHKTQPRQVKEYLRAIIKDSRAAGAEVVLVSVPRLSLLRASIGALSDSPIYAELAEEEGVTLVPDAFSQVLSDSSLRADEVHPNAQGYQTLSAGIHAVLISSGLAHDG